MLSGPYPSMGYCICSVSDFSEILLFQKQPLLSVYEYTCMNTAYVHVDKTDPLQTRFHQPDRSCCSNPDFPRACRSYYNWSKRREMSALKLTFHRYWTMYTSIQNLLFDSKFMYIRTRRLLWYPLTVLPLSVDCLQG